MVSMSVSSTESWEIIVVNQFAHAAASRRRPNRRQHPADCHGLLGKYADGVVYFLTWECTAAGKWRYNYYHVARFSSVEPVYIRSGSSLIMTTDRTLGRKKSGGSRRARSAMASMEAAAVRWDAAAESELLEDPRYVAGIELRMESKYEDSIEFFSELLASHEAAGEDTHSRTSHTSHVANNATRART